MLTCNTARKQLPALLPHTIHELTPASACYPDTAGQCTMSAKCLIAATSCCLPQGPCMCLTAAACCLLPAARCSPQATKPLADMEAARACSADPDCPWACGRWDGEVTSEEMVAHGRGPLLWVSMAFLVGGASWGGTCILREMSARVCSAPECCVVKAQLRC